MSDIVGARPALRRLPAVSDLVAKRFAAMAPKRDPRQVRGPTIDMVRKFGQAKYSRGAAGFVNRRPPGRRPRRRIGIPSEPLCSRIVCW